MLGRAHSYDVEQLRKILDASLNLGVPDIEQLGIELFDQGCEGRVDPLEMVGNLRGFEIAQMMVAEAIGEGAEDEFAVEEFLHG